MFLMSNMKSILEYWIILLPLFLFYYLFDRETKIWKNLKEFYNEYFKISPKGEIILESNPHDKRNSERYQAVMWYLSNNINPTIYRAQEVFYQVYNWNEDIDINKHFFRIEQKKEFKITDDIVGKVESYEKEKKKDTYGNSTAVEELHCIYLKSQSKSVTEIISFLDKVEKDYQKYLLEENLKTQQIIECLWDEKKSKFKTNQYVWNSNVTFENRFFENKQNIIKQIDFFLNHPEYYKKKGIPYQLGILLHGTPGCGKTSFIKALANYTNRHIIDVKLNDNIELPQLKELILNEKIDHHLLIPQDKRIYVFEDIDVMGEIVNKRKNKKDSDTDSDTESIKNKDLSKEDKTNQDFLKLFIKNQSSTYKLPTKGDNNMSYFLNILDGLQENQGRIIIMTTNYIDKIDKAILRPGRIDINLEFKTASNKIILEILSNYWEIDEKEIKEKYPKVKELKNIPHCNITEKCRSNLTIKDTIDNLFKP